VRAETARIAQETGFDETSLETALGDAPSVKDADALAALSAEDRQRIGLIALANREKELILEHYRERMLSRGTVDSLLAAADRLRDRVRLQGPEGYKAASRAQVQLGRGFALALWVHRHIGWEGPLARRLARRFEMLVAAQVVQRELRGFATLSLRRLLGEVTSEALTGLVEERRRILTEALDALEARYPAYAASLRAHYLTLAALRIEQDAYRRSFAESMISREVFADLRRRIAGRGAATRRRPPLDLGLDVHRMIGQVPLFARLPEKRLLAISRLLKPRLAIPGEYIVERGARGTAMYFIVSGQVSVRLPESVAGGGPVTLERGQFFGELSLITRRPRNADVIAEGYCHLLVLDARDFHKLLRSDESLKQEIESVARERLKGPDDGEGLRTAVGED
jgi:CPA1 family monovalent cation:H+ antiporter